MMSMLSNIVSLIDRRLQNAGVTNERARKVAIERGVEAVEKAALKEINDERAFKTLSPRTVIYIQRLATEAYVNEICELLRADIEKQAQKHLLATLGPRVEALEKVIRTEVAP